MSRPFQGLTAAVYESRHALTMKQLVELQGARVLSAPSMKEVPIADNPAVFAFAERWFAGGVDMLILLTGVGTRAMLEVLETRYPKERLLEQMRRTRIVPRGPKPIRVLKELSVPYALEVPEPNTWKELIATLDANAAALPLKGRRVAVQQYGVRNEALARALSERGAELIDVPVYRWALPDDVGPLQAAVREAAEGRVDLHFFTTAVQIEHVLAVAQAMGVADAFKRSLSRALVASVGPDCSDALRQRGVTVDVEPESPKMAPLVLETALKAREILARKGVSS